MLRTLLPFFIVLIATRSVPGDVTVVFGPSPQLLGTISKAIDEAAWTLDVAIYRLDHPEIISNLERACEEGVRVRLLLHNPEKEAKLADQLEGVGVDIREVNQTLHHKFLIADSSTLVTGSCNWSKNVFARYDEDLLTFKNEPSYTNAFRSEFETLWGWSQEYGKAIFPAGKIKREKPSFGRVKFTSSNMTQRVHRGNNIFSTTASLPGCCGSEIIDAINKAETSIKIATTHFRRQDMAVALANAIDRGVSVSILLDQQEYHPEDTKLKNARYDEELAKNGASVRYKCYMKKWTYGRALQMHSKYIIIDSTVITGSLNWSATSELKTLENLLVLDRKEVTQQYRERFNMKWNYGGDTTGGAEDEFFGPRALTKEQLIEMINP